MPPPDRRSIDTSILRRLVAADPGASARQLKHCPRLGCPAAGGPRSVPRHIVASFLRSWGQVTANLDEKKVHITIVSSPLLILHSTRIPSPPPLYTSPISTTTTSSGTPRKNKNKMKNNNSALSMGQKSKFPAMALGLSLAMAGTSFGAILALPNDATTTVSGIDTGGEYEEIDNVTLNITSTGSLTVDALKFQDGDSNASFFNIAGIATMNQLVAGKDGPLTTTISLGGLLTVGDSNWSDFRNDDTLSRIIIEDGGTFRLWNTSSTDGGAPFGSADLARIVDINDVTIVGVAGTGGDAGYDIYAVPEPSSMSLLALGGLALIRRRRRA